MIAIALGNKEAIQFIWIVAEIHTQTENHETVLHYAARHNNAVIALQGCEPGYQIPLNEQSTQKLRTALHFAVQRSNVKIARVLLQHGAQNDWEDRYGKRARDYVGRDEAMEALLEEHHFLKNQTTPTTGCQQAALTNKNQPRKRCQRQPESDDMQPDTSRAHHHKQDEMQPDPSRAPTSSTRATVIATNTQSHHLEDSDVLYDLRRRDWKRILLYSASPIGRKSTPLHHHNQLHTALQISRTRQKWCTIYLVTRIMCDT